MASVNSVIKSLGYAVKQSDDVIKSTAKNANLGTFIKNSVNALKSNEGMATKAVSKQGRQAARQAVENISTKQAYQQTTKKVLDNFNMSDATGTAKKVANTKINNRPDTKKIREISDNIANSKRTQRVIDGHNARSRQTAMDTMVNNVKDSRSTLDITEGNSRKVSEAINNAVDNIKNSPEVPRMPVIDTSMPNSGPQASSIIRNTPIDNTSTGPKYGPRVDSSGNGNKPPNGPKTTVDAPEPPPLENNFDLSNFSDEEIEAAKRKATEAFKEDKLREAAEKDFKNFGNKYFGGIADTYKGTKAGDGFWNSLEAAHKNADGSLRWDRIAGTYAAAAVGSRVLSGGGLYKDKYGNTNLPGIPFI
jgi:hypothetical protein